MALELLNSAMKQLKQLEADANEFEKSPKGALKPNGLPRDGLERRLWVREFVANSDPA